MHLKMFSLINDKGLQMSGSDMQVSVQCQQDTSGATVDETWQLDSFNSNVRTNQTKPELKRSFHEKL